MIIVDVETGGLDPRENPLLSIGAVDFSNQKNTFYGECYPWPNTKITEEALSVNGFDLDYLDKQQPLPILMNDFIRWVENIGDNILAGHNPDFDYGFIKYNCDRLDMKCPFNFRTVDLHSIMYVESFYLSGKHQSLNSSQIYNMLGMKPEPDPHNGLNGALWETEAFNRVINCKYNEEYDL